jgi:hydroxyacylglutathione hydrolase
MAGMFFERVTTPGLAHFSYVLGDAGAAVVIDPRRDVEAYLEIARANDARIRYVFETHRNEDLISGAPLVAEATGASVHHGRALDFGYGEPADDGQTFELGEIVLRVIETPGHTDESISLAVFTPGSGDRAWGVFTGDALFMGGVGRTDFHPERAHEDAGALFDSIFDRILPLGPQALLFPAHGAGSVCGQGLAERPASTLGFEVTSSEMLQLDRPSFVQRKLDERHVQPPYFAMMEHVNRAGASPLPATELRPLAPGELASRAEDGAIVLDVRSSEAFAAAHVPGSLGIPLGLVSSYAGWYLPYDRPILLVSETRAQRDEARRQLERIGYDRVEGYLKGGLTAWETTGREQGRVGAMSVDELEAARRGTEPPLVLDVRSADEHDEGRLPDAHHVHLGQVPTVTPQLPTDRPIVTFCGSGERALVAASLLRRSGLRDVSVCFGSMKAWTARRFPTEVGG